MCIPAQKCQTYLKLGMIRMAMKPPHLPLVFLFVLAIVFAAGAPHAFYCYQETANSSTSCGGLSNGTYATTGTWNNATNTSDADYSTFGNDSGSGADLYVNYSKPAGSTSSSLWQVKDGGALANLSILSSCWAYSSTLIMLHANSSAGAPSATWHCYDGSWQSLRSASSANIYEEALYWDIASSGQVGANITSTGTPVTLPRGAATTVSIYGGNATNLNLQINSTTLHWQGFYGNITGALRLAAGTSTLKTWNVSSVSGQVYISTSPNINFAALASTSVNLSNVDSAFSFLSGSDDSAQNTGVENSNSAINISYYPLSINTRPVIYSRDSTLAANWQQIVLAQSLSYDKNSLVFTGIIRPAQLVFNGQAGDFQIVVPASGINGSTAETYYFYGELR